MPYGQPFYTYPNAQYNAQSNGYVAQQHQYGNLYGQPQQMSQGANNGVSAQFQAQQQQPQIQNIQQQQLSQPSAPVFGGNGIPMSYVNGIEGAKAFVMPPNSETWLIDSEGGFMYHKSTDYVGKAIVKPYLIKEATEDDVYAYKKGDAQPKVQGKPQVEYVTLADYTEREKEYARQINELKRSIDELRNRKPINNNNGGKKDNA